MPFFVSHLRIASSYQWAQETDNRAFSVFTDTELVGDFGTYMRLLSGFIESSLNDTTAKTINIYQKRPNSLVADVIEALVSKNITETEIFNGIWILIAKSILPPTKLGDLSPRDKLTYVKPR